MKLNLFVFALLFTSFVFSQDENYTQCSKRNKHFHSQQKSASLSVAQIQETEKYDVHFYALDIEMNNLVTDVAGTGAIYAKAKVNLDSALFELDQNFTISQIRVNSIPVSYSRVISAIKVPVNSSANAYFVIEIDYNGTPPTSGANPFGGGGMSNDNSNTWGNVVTWSLSEPFSAYEWFPCKQSLTDKADSSAMKITVPNNCKAGSNGILENVVDLGNGKTRYEWKHRHPIDYYLISVAVAKYVEYNIFANPVGAPNPILIQNFIYDNPQTLAAFQDDIDETADFIELYYELFGPYPFENEKYGHCMAPISGGMEHQTMTTQGFFDSELTAHELAHQWWGDNVTCASWTDIWVNEGFASYGEYLMLENLYPGQEDNKMSDVHDNVMSEVDGSVWVLDSLDDGRIFDGRLTYDKGSAIIHQIRYIVNNDSLFFATLREYQSNFAKSTAKGLDVKEIFEAETGIDFDPYFEQWYFGEGYPTYTLKWNDVSNDLLLKLSHTSSASAVTPTFTNPISININRAGTLPDTIVRLNVTSNLDWYSIPNIGDVTSIQLDPANWIINKVSQIAFENNLAAVESLSKENEIKLYPNPANQEINIETPFELANLKIYDMAGRLKLDTQIQNQTVFNSTSLQAGTYLFVINGRRKLVQISR